MKSIIVWLICALASAAVAQPRSLGARAIFLDDNALNIAYLTTLQGSVGINATNTAPSA